ASDFTVTLPPSISSFSPASGPVGTAVTVLGSNFTGTTAVTFNSTPSAFTVVSDSRIDSTVPSGATTGRVRVTTPEGTAESGTDFTVLPPPSISSFSPANGPVGTAVTVLGSNFSGATAATFNSTTSSFTVVSASRIDATV